MSTTPKETNQPLVVVVSGGGPVGLTFSLHLTMMLGKHAKIFIYEGRWFVDDHGKTRWQGEEQGKTRRDQVVTLQDHVIEQMPECIQQGLFKRINERVWPTSRNIPIREVEDRLFDLIQPFVHNGQVELVPENLHEQTERLIKGDFDVLVGADGSNSFVRLYCNIQMISEGVEYACGVAYNIPEGVDPADEPLHQALNCILTISQTRYLVNSSSSRRGYLNIRLKCNEYEELKERLQSFQSRNEPLDLLDYDKCPQSPVWSIIRQGLDYFKIPPKYVFRVIPIEINVCHASIVVRELRYGIEKAETASNGSKKRQFKTALAFLVGDAAMNAHFWPGRGMNSGMKGAMALARNIVRACTRKDTIEIRTPLHFLDFLDYEGFMARLRAREQQGRSLRILVVPIDQCVDANYPNVHHNPCYERYSKKLIRKLKESRDRLEERPEWPHQSRKITDQELQLASNRVLPQSVAQLSLANPWPTREMSGVEVLVEDTFSYDPKNFLPVPKSIPTTSPFGPTPIIRYRIVSLWIVGDKTDRNIPQRVKEIQASQSFVQTSTNAEKANQLVVVRTVQEASEWIKSNRALIDNADVRFKVITVWTVNKDETAVDVIDAVRPQSPRAPVLVFTSKMEERQSALELANVMTTSEEFELKEFVGVNQETQWNPGCRVAPTRPPSPPRDATSDIAATPSPSRPLLLWIDSETSDLKAAKEIRRKYPELEMIFQTRFSDAELHLRHNEREMDEREKVIIISRGYYAPEKKGFLDVFQLFQTCNASRTHLGVYTGNRASLLERNPNPPPTVEIFDKRPDLLAFIDRCFAR